MWPSASKPHAPCCRGALLSNLSNCLNPLPLDLGPILADHQHKRARFVLNSFPVDLAAQAPHDPGPIGQLAYWTKVQWR